MLKTSWWNYFELPIVMLPIIMVFVPVTARLLSGHGYWVALQDSLTERHLPVYLAGVAESARNLVGMVWLLI